MLWPCFPTRSHSEVLGFRPATYEFEEDKIQLISMSFLVDDASREETSALPSAWCGLWLLRADGEWVRRQERCPLAFLVKKQKGTCLWWADMGTARALNQEGLKEGRETRGLQEEVWAFMKAGPISAARVTQTGFKHNYWSDIKV